MPQIMFFISWFLLFYNWNCSVKESSDFKIISESMHSFYVKGVEIAADELLDEFIYQMANKY